VFFTSLNSMLFNFVVFRMNEILLLQCWFHGFQSYETAYSQFHLEETSSLFLFITLLPHHQDCLLGTPFNKMKPPLGVVINISSHC
jgi:hypothetical protein